MSKVQASPLAQLTPSTQAVMLKLAQIRFDEPLNSDLALAANDTHIIMPSKTAVLSLFSVIFI